jgi:hypothetical protein
MNRRRLRRSETRAKHPEEALQWTFARATALSLAIYDRASVGM